MELVKEISKPTHCVVILKSYAAELLRARNYAHGISSKKKHVIKFGKQNKQNNLQKTPMKANTPKFYHL